MASSRLGRVTSCAPLEGRWTISLGYDESGSEGDLQMLHNYRLNNSQSKIRRKNEYYRRSRNKVGGLLPQRRMDEGSGRSLCKGRRQCGATRDGKYAGRNARTRSSAWKNRLVGEKFRSAQLEGRRAVFGRGYFRRAVRCGRDRESFQETNADVGGGNLQGKRRQSCARTISAACRKERVGQSI